MNTSMNVAASLLICTSLLACTDDPGGPIPPFPSTQVLLTDAPFPYDLVDRVDVHIVRVEASEVADTTSTSFEWIEIVEPNTTFNLIDLQQGTTALVGEGDLPAGQYQAIRLVINTNLSSITLKDGSKADVEWQVHGELALHALVEEALAVGSEGASIVIDFDVGRSFLYQEIIVDSTQSDPPDFLFIPWIRAVNEAATGGISGTVLGTDIEGNPVPLANATVSVLRGNFAESPETWGTVATGATDENGHFKIDFLLARHYIVRASPPSHAILAPATQGGVEVAVGQQTTVNLTLTNTQPTTFELVGVGQLNVGESAIFRAVVTDFGGDTLSGQFVSWQVGPGNVIVAESPNGGAPTGEYALITGVSRGVGVVFASSFDLFDSVGVVITDPNAAPVATVELSPTTQTVSVFDSLSIAATLKDALGNAVTGTYVTWSTSDSTVLQLTGPGNVFATTSPTYATFGALSPGTVTVTAVSEGKVGNATVIVQQ